jgi:hypothetical protein
MLGRLARLVFARDNLNLLHAAVASNFLRGLAAQELQFSSRCLALMVLNMCMGNLAVNCQPAWAAFHAPTAPLTRRFQLVDES